MLLLTAAALLAVCAAGAPVRGSIGRRAWASLALLFVALSLDEHSGLHEMLGPPIRRGWDATGVLHFAWVVPGAAPLLLFKPRAAELFGNGFGFEQPATISASVRPVAITS